ncbi:hypothetical protein [Phyllobacterium sp. SB3]|uniref:hypothetical protein n=1 Tax=Phyllobacterium sp. SB3 TaxID=3156073 RepID=UPI0032AF73B3
MTNKGMLIVRTNPPADFEEELNDWYETDHITERMTVPGFEAARRYVIVGGAHRYLALYDIEGIGVLQSPRYLAVAGDNVTPWTRRVIRRGRFIRSPTVQIYPGDALTTQASRLLLVGFHGLGQGDAETIVEGAKRSFIGKPKVTQLRVFATTDGDNVDFFLVVEGHGQIDTLLEPDLFGSVAECLDTVTLYEPYS